MPSIDVRPFQRADRHQVTALVNAHIEAVLPGASVSVNAVMSQLERVLGTHATRFVASLDARVAGFFELQTDLTNGGAPRLAGWGDVWELFVEPDLRRRGIATWMVAEAAGWLRLAGVERVLDYAIAGEDEAHLAFATRLGWRELTRAERGWTRD